MRLRVRAAFLMIGLLTVAVGGNCSASQAKRPSENGGRVSQRVVDGLLHSKSLNRDMHYRILLPRGYQTGQKRFAALYLLHGLYGDYLNWDTRTKLGQYAEPLPLIIVMPDADNSWYTNSATVPGDRFEDYIVKDLIPEIDSHYRTIRSRQSRAIAGLSMGGYGAMKFALKYPEMFAFAGSFSGAFDAPRDLDTRVPQFREKLLSVFGPSGHANRSANDLFFLLDRVEPASLPYLYVQCGTQDDFLAINREFVSSLPRRKIGYEYHETPGGHSWDYWDRSAQNLLHSLSKVLNLSANVNSGATPAHSIDCEIDENVFCHATTQCYSVSKESLAATRHANPANISESTIKRLRVVLAIHVENYRVVATYDWLRKTNETPKLIPLTIFAEAEVHNKTYWCRNTFTNYRIFDSKIKLLANKLDK